MYDDDDDEKINICHSCLLSSTSYVANNSDIYKHTLSFGRGAIIERYLLLIEKKPD